MAPSKSTRNSSNILLPVPSNPLIIKGRSDMELEGRTCPVTSITPCVLADKQASPGITRIPAEDSLGHLHQVFVGVAISLPFLPWWGLIGSDRASK